MKLTALRLHNIRRFAGRGVAIEDIGDGVNVLCEANEFGKSTCFDALHALFFQPFSGTPGAVQALRPYSGGSPLIEADIITSGGRFQLRKQYYTGRKAQVTELGTGRLLAQADEAEAFIAELVRGGTAGPAGLLWVRQGNTGLERRAKADEDSEKKARETVLTSVQGEVEAVTGGRRMRAVIEFCESELSKLVTNGYKPKAGYAYEIALMARDGLAEKTRILDAEVTTLHAALEDRRKIRARLNELDQSEDESIHHKAVDDAERMVSEARVYQERRKVLAAQAALMQSRHEAAANAHLGYQDALARWTSVQAAMAHATGLRDEAASNRQQAMALSDAANIEVERAEATEQEMRDLFDRLDRAMKARAAAADLLALRDRLSQAETLRQVIETAEAESRALRVPETQVEALETIEHDIARLRAAETVRATTLRMTYETAGPPLVRLNDSPLVDQTDIALLGTARLTLPGLGVLTVRPAQVNESDLAAKLAAHIDLLAAIGVNNLPEARQKLAQAKRHASEIELARQRLDFIAPDGLEVLRERIALLEADRSGDLELEGDPAQARYAWVEAGKRVSEARNQVIETRPAREQADQSVINAEIALSNLRADLEALGAVLGEPVEREAQMHQRTEAAQLAQQAAEAGQAEFDALTAQPLDLDNAEAALRRAKSVISGIDNEKATLRQDLAELNGRINTQSGRAIEEDLAEIRDQLRSTEDMVARFEHEVALLRHLKDTLNAARNEAREHYFAPVLGELRPLLGLLFDDATVTFDDDTLLPRAICRNGLEEQVPVLSGGMREQLAVLTRLAFARLLAREGRPAPVILDDALVYSDDDRIEKMFDALHRQAREQQIIVFSCRQRAFSLLGGNRLRLKDWTPN